MAGVDFRSTVDTIVIHNFHGYATLDILVDHVVIHPGLQLLQLPQVEYFTVLDDPGTDVVFLVLLDKVVIRTINTEKTLTCSKECFYHKLTSFQDSILPQVEVYQPVFLLLAHLHMSRNVLGDALHEPIPVFLG